MVGSLHDVYNFYSIQPLSLLLLSLLLLLLLVIITIIIIITYTSGEK